MSLAQQVRRIGVISPPLPWDKPLVNRVGSEEVVVMLHGLWRSVRAMQPMAERISKEGYSTINIPYASFRHDLDGLVAQVIKDIKPWIEEGKTIHFVTHSLGGVVVKRLLESLETNQVDKIGRVVMLAPPHKGSEIVDWLGNSPFPVRMIKGALGPAGEFLSSKEMGRQSEEFPANIEAAVIMGEKSALPFFRKLLDASNDGIVSVEKGRLLGVKEFKIVEADHTFISSDELVMALAVKFINDGTMEK